MDRGWGNRAIAQITADFQRSADTHMIRLQIPSAPEFPVYLKDESTHPSGSLKHRLARSLFLYALCNGWIHEKTTVIEASSGSTAVSEAYFANLLGLPFVAVMPESTSERKIAQIEFYGGRCHFVKGNESIMDESRRLANQMGTDEHGLPLGHFMDQFTFAERATDWRGNNNIAESLFRQLELEPNPIPRWIVVGAGTGGTSATIGRYIRYFQMDTQLCVVDPEYSAFYDHYLMYMTRHPNVNEEAQITAQSVETPSDDCNSASRIEGIGRPCVEPSFLPSIVDRMVKVPDTLSLGAMIYLEKVLGRRCGASTGTNLIGVIELIESMRRRKEAGPIVSLICDSGERYGSTYFCEDWREAKGLNCSSAEAQVEQFFECGTWPSDATQSC